MDANRSFPQADARLNRIRRIIKFVRLLISSTLILFVFFGLLFLADLFGYPLVGPGVKISFSPLVTYTSPFVIPPFVLILAALRTGLWFVGAAVLFRLLDRLEAREFFTAPTVHLLKILGILLIVDWVMTKLLDATAQAGFRLSFLQLLLGALVVLFAWIVDEGRKMQEDQELTV